MRKIASVFISNCTREFDKEYHYIIPDNLLDMVKPGIRVIVPFGKSNRSTEAYVFNVLDDTGTIELKSINSIVDNRPLLTFEMLKIALWMKRRYICTHSDAVKCMLPPGVGVKSTRIVKLERYDDRLKENVLKVVNVLVEAGWECELEELKNRVKSRSFSRHLKCLEDQGIISVYEEQTSRIREKTVRVAYISRRREEIIDEIESNRIKRIQQIRVLEMLLDNEYISVSDIVRFAAVSNSVLDTLKKYGYIDFKEIEVERNPFHNRIVEPTYPLKPTIQQLSVLQKVKGNMDEGMFKEYLLHGVTGSGKTEVYLQLIQHCFDAGKTAIVLVPEISLTPQMVERFKGRFGDDVAVLHSRLSLGERYDQWRLIRDGRIKVVVGARSAIFAPFENIGLVIIDEEHENTYKSETTPKYHARDVARERCIFHNAILLYGSATPSIESYFKAKHSNIGFLEMSERANNMHMPPIEIVDMRRELEEGNKTIFSKRLAEEIERNIKTRQQTMLFLNRRGHSSFVLCRKCGLSLMCVNCNITLTYHAHDERLICHYCGYTTKTPSRCPRCESGYIRHFGTGTQRVEEELGKCFPESTVIRMDMDTTTCKNSHEDILSSFRQKNINIMVGTQMIAKGHDFPNVTLVGILAADSLLNTGDYRASEKTFQLITQVAGRAGRGELPGRVVMQTYNTEDFSIVAACKHDYVSFYEQEIKLRERLDYPPYTNIAAVILSGINDRFVFEQAKELKGQLALSLGDTVEGIVLLGPARSPLSKIKNKYRWRLIIKCRDLDKLVKALSNVSDGFYKRKDRSTVELSVDINPVNML